MNVNLQTIFHDPRLHFHVFNGEYVRFTQMSRETYRRSLFLDRRIEVADSQIYRVPIDPLLEHLAQKGFEAPRLCYIHHVAQCGSTLLARALDQNAHALGLREPFPLRQLGVKAGAGFASVYADQDFRAMLGLALTMLGRRFESDQPVVVKGNVPVSMIADAIADADPGRPTILLYFGLDDYLAAVLRSDNHQAWVNGVVSELRIEEDPAVGSLTGRSSVIKAAAMWLSLMGRYHRLQSENRLAMALDANLLFEQPADTIFAAAQLFEIPMARNEAQAIASGPLFSTYSKNPDLAYDPHLRTTRREETKARLISEIAEARSWVEAKAADMGLPKTLTRPLLGELQPLI